MGDARVAERLTPVLLAELSSEEALETRLGRVRSAVEACAGPERVRAEFSYAVLATLAGRADHGIQADRSRCRAVPRTDPRNPPRRLAADPGPVAASALLETSRAHLRPSHGERGPDLGEGFPRDPGRGAE